MTATAQASGNTPLSLFADRQFVALWLTGGATSTVRWLEMLATAVFVLEATGSPFTLSVLIALRMLPLALFGAIAGVLAERHDRRLLQIVGLVLMIALSIAQALLIVYDAIEVWHLALGAFLNGVFWTLDMPARRTLLGDVAGHQRVGAAMSFDSVTGNGTRMLGPMIGGALLAQAGLAGAFWLGALIYAFALLAISRIPKPKTKENAEHSVWTSLTSGIRYTRANRELSGILLITLAFNIWAFPFVAMVPVLGQAHFNLGPLGVGILASMEGVGAFCAAIVIAFFTPARWFKKLYFYGTAGTMLALPMLASADQALTASIVLMCAGVGTAAFATMQGTLTFLAAGDEIRSRVMGVLSVCIGVGPLGFLHMGLLAHYFGAPTALTISGVEGLIALALIGLLWPEVR